MDAMDLILTRDTNYEGLSSTIRTIGATIESLTLHSSSSSPEEEDNEEPDWNSDAVREFFLDISTCMPNLKNITLHNFGMYSDSVPIHLITMLLSNTDAPTIESFHLNSVCLMGNPNDMQELASKIRQQANLQSFRWSYCGFSTMVSSSSSLLHPIIMALSSLTSLKQVELWSYAEGRLGILQKDSLSELLGKSSSLLALHVEGFTLNDDMMQAMAEVIRDNKTTLQKLDLHIVKEAPTGSLELAESLRHNKSLQVLELFLSSTDDDDNNDNQHKDGHNDFFRKLSDALMDNASLQDLRIHSYRAVTALEEEAFANMLETSNHSLQFLHLSGFEGDCRPKIEYFLSWNRRGRRQGELQQKTCQLAAHQKSQQQQKLQEKEQRVEMEYGRGRHYKNRKRQLLNRPS